MTALILTGTDSKQKNVRFPVLPFYSQLRDIILSMKYIVFLLLLCIFSLSLQAQKKKGKTTPSENYDSLVVPPPPPSKSKGKSKSVNYDSAGVPIPPAVKSKSKSKGKTHPSQIITDYVIPEPKPDTAKNFTGVIKYRMTSDDPADNDSVFVIFGQNKIRVRIFIPGYREGQFFENTMIANFTDSSFTELDTRNFTYTTEKLAARNEGTELALVPTKNKIPILANSCTEFKGAMTTKDQDEFEAACLLSPNHYFNAAMDFNFLGIHPIVFGYQIALGFRSKTDQNENTFIMAYKIEPGNTDQWFDLSQYRPKK